MPDNIKITRYAQDMDGCMEPCHYGSWICPEDSQMTKNIFAFPTNPYGTERTIPEGSQVFLQYTDRSIPRSTGLCAFVDWYGNKDVSIFLSKQIKDTGFDHCHPIESALNPGESEYFWPREYDYVDKEDFTHPANRLRIWWAHNLAVTYAKQFYGE